MSAMAKAAPCTKQSKCPAPKELLKQRIEYKLSSNDDDVMEWHGGVVKKKYKGAQNSYTCTLDDGIEKAKQTTRNFAKRQTTWYRHQISADLEVPGFGDGAEAGAVDALARFLG